MSTVEVGCQDGDVVLLITVPAPDGKTADLTRLPLTPDEARHVCNGLGEAIKCLTTGVMT